MAFINHWARLVVEPRKVIGVRHFPRYIADWIAYKKLPGGGDLRVEESFPCLSDKTSYTPFDPHYHYQAVWLAGKLAGASPDQHVDIGSSVGTIAAIAAFLPIIFVDYRPLKPKGQNMIPVAGDLLSLPFADGSLASLSCLHVIEHVGLGRYGDPLDPKGSIRASFELQRVLAPGGSLYLSVPVGRERVQFNAQRIFSPSTVLSMFDGLTIQRFGLIDDSGEFMEDADLSQGDTCEYGCGLFEFTRS